MLLLGRHLALRAEQHQMQTAGCEVDAAACGNLDLLRTQHARAPVLDDRAMDLSGAEVGSGDAVAAQCFAAAVVQAQIACHHLRARRRFGDPRVGRGNLGFFGAGRQRDERSQTSRKEASAAHAPLSRICLRSRVSASVRSGGVK
jgi:hypothetical protein